MHWGNSKCKYPEAEGAVSEKLKEANVTAVGRARGGGKRSRKGPEHVGPG